MNVLFSYLLILFFHVFSIGDAEHWETGEAG